MGSMDDPRITRRAFVLAGAAPLTLSAAGYLAPPMKAGLPNLSAIPDLPNGVLVNDVHSQLNPTRVLEIVKPQTVEALHAVFEHVRSGDQRIAIAGGRHAMGGQQFADNAVLVDTLPSIEC